MQTILDFFHIIFVPSLDYNTRVVIFGILFYSMGCGMIGNYMLLQKRTLLSDVLSHATFPGIMSVFIIMVAIGAYALSKNLLILMIGALGSTLFALVVLKGLQRFTILKSDAAQSIILSVFFGVGIALLGIAQRIPEGNSAGMMTYIYGNTASMQLNDAKMFMGASIFVLAFIIYKKRDLTLMSFDREYACTMGIKVHRLDFMLMFLVLIQVVIGLQAIGLLMVSAMLIVPVVVARFWTESINSLIIISVVIGMISTYIGSLISANSLNFPTGAVIVTVMEIFFVFSLFFGKKKGIIIKYFELKKYKTHINIEHILRVLFEYLETKPSSQIINLDFVHSQLGHTKFRLSSLLKKMERLDYLVLTTRGLEFTNHGISFSKTILRKHRLWEAYLLNYTDVSAEEVDYSADTIEHVLGDDLTSELEAIIEKKYIDTAIKSVILPSPHKIKTVKLTDTKFKGGT